MLSYFPYVGAFAFVDDAISINAGLAGIGMAVAPIALIVFAFVSRNPEAPKRVLQAMGALLLLGLGVGLVSPALGATAGFGVGAALTVNPPGIAGYLTRRIVGVAFAVFYTLLLLVVATPAGVFTGAIIPVLMVGFADEYSAWLKRRQDSPAGD